MFRRPRIVEHVLCLFIFFLSCLLNSLRSFLHPSLESQGFAQCTPNLQTFFDRLAPARDFFPSIPFTPRRYRFVHNLKRSKALPTTWPIFPFAPLTFPSFPFWNFVSVLSRWDVRCRCLVDSAAFGGWFVVAGEDMPGEVDVAIVIFDWCFALWTVHQGVLEKCLVDGGLARFPVRWRVARRMGRSPDPFSIHRLRVRRYGKLSEMERMASSLIPEQRLLLHMLKERSPLRESSGWTRSYSESLVFCLRLDIHSPRPR